MSLEVDQFLWRLLEHVPPRGMHTVRGYGLYAGSQRQRLNVARGLLGQQPVPEPPEKPPSWQELCAGMGDLSVGHCPECKAVLVVHSHFKSGRGPPGLAVAGVEMSEVA